MTLFPRGAAARLIRHCASLLAAGLFATSAAHADEASVKKLIEPLLGAKVDSVQKVKYGGLYEVVVGGDILYTDEAASFIVLGSIVDTKTQQNITKARGEQLSAFKWEDLPLQHAVKTVRGNGSRVFAVFADPNCGYCKRLEKDIAKMNDITMYTFLYPILAPNSADKSRGVWCAPDPAKAWLDLMVNNKPVNEKAPCPSAPLRQVVELGQKLRVQGTPAILLPNGERIGGAIPLAELERRLAAVKK